MFKIETCCNKEYAEFYTSTRLTRSSHVGCTEIHNHSELVALEKMLLDVPGYGGYFFFKPYGIVFNTTPMIPLEETGEAMDRIITTWKGLITYDQKS